MYTVSVWYYWNYSQEEELSKVGMEQSLVDWATPYIGDKRDLFRIMDTRLGGQYPQKMSEVLAKLDHLESATKPGTRIGNKHAQIDSPRGSNGSVVQKSPR